MSAKSSWMARAACTAALCISLVSAIYADGTPRGNQYRLFDMFGGDWHDAEKSSDNSEDDLMCWAAQTANILTWTRWGRAGGMTNSDETFQYFQDHWTDKAGNSYYALDWWFDGTNDGPRDSKWSQVDVPGGGFCLNEDISSYRHFSSHEPTSMTKVNTYVRNGWGTGLFLSGPKNHLITCWGLNVDPTDPDNYYGVWVTDSDDDKGGRAPRPDTLPYYEVRYTSGAWHLQDYNGSSSWYVSEVIGIEPMPLDWSGDIDPASPTTWDSSTRAYIGKRGTGSLTITNGGTVVDRHAILGYFSGATGEVTVDGAGSTWTNNGDLVVANRGRGTLSITRGAAVSVQNRTCVSRHPGSSGTIHLDQGTLTTGTLLCAPDDLKGTGTIRANGLVTDRGLVFDAAHGLNRTFTIDDNPGQSITVHLHVDGSSGMGAGFSGRGTMTIADGRALNSSWGVIGVKPASTGVVTVGGAGSMWTMDSLTVGEGGGGTLHITGGGSVVSGFGNIGRLSSSTGAVTVDGAGSTWTIGGELTLGDDGAGKLSITGGGVVSSGSSRLGVNPEEEVGNSGATGEVTVDGAGSTWTTNDRLYVGCCGIGKISITDGGSVSSGHTVIADHSSSTGAVTVSGEDSEWRNGCLTVGYKGNGSLTITRGGSVSSGGYVLIADQTGSTGEVMVNGAGSTWATKTDLVVGNQGTAALNVSRGGAINVGRDLSIGYGSLLSLSVSNNNMLEVGTAGGGDFYNWGTVHLQAQPGVATGIYTPISISGNWRGDGTYQAFGGAWDHASHTFNVAVPERVVGGQQALFDLACTQRVQVDRSLMASFMPTVESSWVNFTATPTDVSALAELQAILGGDELQGSWDFEITGLTSENPSLLSFALTGTADLDDLRVWHDAGRGWSVYEPEYFALSDGWASFTVDGFSSYAVSVVPESAKPIPEPITMVSGLIGFGMVAEYFRRRLHCA